MSKKIEKKKQSNVLECAVAFILSPHTMMCVSQ